MTLMTREALMARGARKTLEVADPETGDVYVLHTLTLAEKDAYDAIINQFDGKGGRTLDLSNFRAPLLAAAVAEPKLTAEEWRNLSGEFSFLVQAAQKLNGYTAEAADEAAKNSDGGPAAGSSSDSPSV